MTFGAWGGMEKHPRGWLRILSGYFFQRNIAKNRMTRSTVIVFEGASGQFTMFDLTDQCVKLTLHLIDSASPTGLFNSSCRCHSEGGRFQEEGSSVEGVRALTQLLGAPA